MISDDQGGPPNNPPNNKDEQVEILRAIWRQLFVLDKNLGDRIDGVGQRIDGLGQRIDDVRTELSGRIDDVRTELSDTNLRLGRVEQGLMDLGGFMRRLALDMAEYEKFHHITSSSSKRTSRT